MVYLIAANITMHCLKNNFEIDVILKGAIVRPLSGITAHVGATWFMSI